MIFINMKFYKYFLHCLFFSNTLVQVAFSNHENKTHVKVSIYYESLCPDSVKFFRDQFRPNFAEFNDYLIYDFVPYGKAMQKQHSSDKWEFTCQHGDDECLYNSFQACAINFMKESPAILASFISCHMNQVAKAGLGEKCLNGINVNLNDLNKCTFSNTGSELLAALGKRTQALRPSIEFVPTIILNDVYDDLKEDAALDNFKALICKELNSAPKVCKNM